MNAASPVVTGRADDEAASTVFQGWRNNLSIQERFNPFLELEAAAQLRDEVLSRFVLKPGHIVGYPTNERAMQAQFALIMLLARERRWGRDLINNYFGIELPDRSWAVVFAEAVV